MSSMSLSRFASGIMGQADTLDMRERPEGGDLAWLAAYLQRQEAAEAADGSETTTSEPPDVPSGGPFLRIIDSANSGTSEPSPLASPVSEVERLSHASETGDRTSWVTSGDDDDIPEGQHAQEQKRRRKVGWTKAEDLAILATVRRLGTQWPRIAAQLPGRTPDAVRNRWHRLQKTHALADTDEGRAALDALLLSCGVDKDWMPAELPGGSPVADRTEQCIKGADHGRAMWTAEEDALIEEGVRRFGCKWRKVASALPGRSDSSVRNRWMRLQKERTAAAQSTSPAPLQASNVGNFHPPPAADPHATVAATAAAAACMGDAAMMDTAPPAAAAAAGGAARPAPPPPIAMKRRLSDAFNGGGGALTSPLLGFGIDLLVDAVEGALADDSPEADALRKSLGAGDQEDWDFGNPTPPSTRNESEPPSLFENISVCEMSSLSLRASRNTGSSNGEAPREATEPAPAAPDEPAVARHAMGGLSLLLSAMAVSAVVAVVRSR